MWQLATIEAGDSPQGCVVLDDVCHPIGELADAAGETCPDQLIDCLVDWPTHAAMLERLARAADGARGVPIREARLLTPLRWPGKILCAGANYYSHMDEMGFAGTTKESQRLFFFMKPPRQALVGPGATVEMPRGTAKLDWEIELAVVIGRRARHVAVADALGAVAAYSVAIDLSARDENQAPDQFYKFDWVAGKGQDTCCPMGPFLTPAAFVPDPQALSLRLSVNGEPKQDGHSSDMIHDVAEQIARASQIMTLEPGDVLLTGTPAGVGVPKGTFLAPGDRIVAEIEGLGALDVQIREPA